MSEISLPKLDWKVVFNRASPAGRRGWGRVRAAQLLEMSRAMTIAAWGQTFNALLIVYMMIGRAPAKMLTLWLAALIALMGFAAFRNRRLGTREIRSLPRATIDRAAYHSVFFGLVWSFPARYFFEMASHGQQLAICVITATMMAGAAFIFAPVPAAAAGYVVIMGVAATRMLMTTDSLIIAMIGPVYSAALLMMVLINGRNFMQRKCLDLALEERQEAVKLLLREYENSDADWLWQTNGQFVFQTPSARFARAIGRASDELASFSLLDLLKSAPKPDQSTRRMLAAAEAAISRREAFSDLIVPVHAAGAIRCLQLTADAGLVAVAFSPIRERLQRSVDRLLYGDRGDPHAALDRLAVRLEDAATAGGLLDIAATEVATALRVPYVAIEVTRPEGNAVLASHGSPPAGPCLRTTCVVEGRPVGVVVLGPVEGGELTGRERRLLDTLLNIATTRRDLAALLGVDL
jgi:hypothetical protein